MTGAAPTKPGRTGHETKEKEQFAAGDVSNGSSQAAAGEGG